MSTKEREKKVLEFFEKVWYNNKVWLLYIVIL